jgi:hypothetical protein
MAWKVFALRTQSFQDKIIAKTWRSTLLHNFIYFYILSILVPCKNVNNLQIHDY